MSHPEYDIVTVGGGMAASCLARSMAEKGARVLILEREREFKDRVRGEAMVPWGVGEARELGVYNLLRDTCAHEAKWFDVFLGPMQMMHRDLSATTPQQASVCTFYHPRMQEVLIGAAEKAGTEVRRGALVSEIRPGSRASVTFQHDGQVIDVRTRLVVAADGRISSARRWAGFDVDHDPPTLFLAGLWMDGITAAEDASFLLMNPALYRGAFIFPQGGGCARVYLAYPVSSGFRLQGDADIPRFIEECLKTGVPREYLTKAQAKGPLASFETADTWAAHPYKDGVALIGDAAASSDPSWGNGMSLSLRGARILRDGLLASDDWDAAGHAYAEEFDRVYDVIHNVTNWSRQIFMESGPEADARRAKAMPRIAQDPTRVPDHGIGGPDLPFDKRLSRLRFFGDD